MNFPVLLISEIVGVIAVVLILSISPVVKNKRPLQFLYPKREGSAALTVGILVLLFTAFVQRFQPLLFAQLINFTSYPGLFNAPKPSFATINALTAALIFSAAIIFPVGISLFIRKQPLLSIGLSKPGLRIGLQTGAVLVILVIFLQGKIFDIINGLSQGAFLTLAVAFVAVLGEEVVFRGYIQPRFAAWLGEKWGILAAILIICRLVGFTYNWCIFRRWTATIGRVSISNYPCFPAQLDNEKDWQPSHSCALPYCPSVVSFYVTSFQTI